MTADSTWANDFSYGYFESVLRAIASRFELRLVGDGLNAAARSPQLFLRHDVDVSLTRALAMAEIEARCDVRSTYMVIPDSRLYDLRTDAAQRILRQLIDLGHEVALHCEVTDENRFNNSPLVKVEEQILSGCKFIEDVTGKPVRSVSFHRPMPQFLRGEMLICERINAYAKELMVNYMSDSKGRWRSGEPLAILPTIDSPVTQILIHPIWWGLQHMTSEERLQEFFETATQGQPAEFAAIFDANLASTIKAVRRKGNKAH